MGRPYFQHLAALLEPDAIEAPQINAFSYPVELGQTKWLLSAWGCQINGRGRLDVRDPRGFLPISGCTLSGIKTGAYAVILDPTKPIYQDAEQTYYDRLDRLVTLPTRAVGTSGAATVPILPGPYGMLWLNNTFLDYAWCAPGAGAVGFGGANEINDTVPIRIGNSFLVPLNKLTTAHSSPSGNGTAYGFHYVNLPSDWSAVPDPLAPYAFRDDFTGAVIDIVNTWNRVQSGVGTVEIEPNFQWVKATGNSSWGANAMYTRSFSVDRAAGGHFLLDVSVPADAGHAAFVVGFADGGGYSFSDFPHAVGFLNDGQGHAVFAVYENGTNRGVVGNGWSAGAVYRVRITIAPGSTSAVYELQANDGLYPMLGGNTWAPLTPVESSNATATLYPGLSIANPPTAYFGDLRIY